jgi:hypothetical protein
MARRIDLTAQTWHALDALSYETGRPVSDLADEAFADLFTKHRRPRSLREALRDSARRHAFTDNGVGVFKRG